MGKTFTVDSFHNYFVLFSSIAVNNAACSTLYFGNISTYINSLEFSLRKSPNFGFDVDPSWMLPIYLTSKVVGTFLVDIIKRKFGLRVTSCVGIVTFLSSIYLTAFTVTHSVWATILTFMVAGGVGSGMVQTCSMVGVAGWFSQSHLGVASAIPISAASIGAFFLNILITNYINPRNIKPDTEVDHMKLFSQPAILKQVPSALLVLGTVASGYIILAFCFMKKPPGPTASQDTGEEQSIEVTELKTLKTESDDFNATNYNSNSQTDITILRQQPEHAVEKRSHSVTASCSESPGQGNLLKLKIPNHNPKTISTADFPSDEVDVREHNSNIINHIVLNPKTQFLFHQLEGQKARSESSRPHVLEIGQNTHARLPPLNCNGAAITPSSSSPSPKTPSSLSSPKTPSSLFSSNSSFSSQLSTPSPSLSQASSPLTSSSSSSSSGYYSESGSIASLQNHDIIEDEDYHDVQVLENDNKKKQQQQKISSRCQNSTTDTNTVSIKKQEHEHTPSDKAQTDTKTITDKDSRCIDTDPDSLNFTPSQVIASRVFYVIECVIIAQALGFIVVVNYYKLYGQMWIKNDHFRDVVSSACSVCVSAFMLTCGKLMDTLGAKNTVVAQLAANAFFLSLWFFAAKIDQWLYMVWTVVVLDLHNNYVVIVPLLALKIFGKQHFTTNYGLLQIASLAVYVIAPTVIQNVIGHLGWFWLFVSTSFIAFIALIIVLVAMPHSFTPTPTSTSTSTSTSKKVT